MFSNSRQGTPVANRRRLGNTLSPPPGLRGRTPVKDFRAGSAAPSNATSHAPASAGQEDSRVYVKDENYQVSLFASLPVEVQQLLNAADHYSQVYKGQLDVRTGFAQIISRDFVYVWSFARRIAAPTCFRFPCPPAPSGDLAMAVHAPVPLAAFVDYGSSAREPGVLIIGTTGQIRFWETISAALTGVDKYHVVNLPLERGEVVRHQLPLSRGVFILSTSQSRLFRFSVSFTGGRGPSLHISTFTRPKSMLSRLGSSLLFGVGSIPLDPRTGIISLCSNALEEGGGKIVWVIKHNSIESWKCDFEGADHLMGEWAELNGLLTPAVLASSRAVGLMSETADMQIVSAAVPPQKANQVKLLVSYVSTSGGKSRAFLLVTLNFHTGAPIVKETREINYTADPDPRPLSQPELHLTSSQTMYITFANAIILLEDELEEPILLKSQARNRFLGSSTTENGELVSCTATTGILKAETLYRPDVDKSLSSWEIKTAKLKSRLERAVYFGDRDDNPLAFDLGLNAEGDLAGACEAVGEEILASTSSLLPSILDMRTHIGERAGRMRALIVLLNEQNLLAKLPQTTRRQLSLDADRIAAASQLWSHYNTRLQEDGNKNGPGLLSRAIATYMRERGDVFSEDPTRTFFRNKIPHLGSLLEEVDRTLRNALVVVSHQDRGALLHEACQINLLTFNAIMRQRSDTGHLYGLDLSSIPMQPWTSRPALIDSLQFLFEAAEQAVKDSSRDLGTAGDALSVNRNIQNDLKASLCDLADFLLALYEERLQYLRGQDSSSAEFRVMQERYASARPRLIQALVPIGRSNHAYILAEKHEDFRTLVELCQNPVYGSAAKTEHYIQKYQKNFAFSLYQWLVEKGQFKTLVTQDEAYAGLLSDFLQATDNPRISWIHNLSLSNFDSAGKTLLEEIPRTQSLREREVMLSISKLSHLASLEDIDLQHDAQLLATQKARNLVISQKVLLGVFEKGLPAPERKASEEKKAESIAKHFAPRLQHYPALRLLFIRLIKQMLQGLALSVEGLVDVYTLQTEAADPQLDEPDETSGQGSGQVNEQRAQRQFWNFAAALALLHRSPEIPPARLQLALANVWRRIYLRDDWETIHSATGYSDQDQANIIRSTALFQAFVGASYRDALNLNEDDLWTPNRALFRAEEIDLKACFPGSANHEISLLEDDLRSESSELERLSETCSLPVYRQEGLRLYSEFLQSLPEESNPTEAGASLSEPIDVDA